ncbi:hypothetical protein J5X84_40980 [Streptosporangiaceae bacterium NEAU-GS5]|nr:hypothetical protein [Streptosporangiaceae bacterium NEAU-GS5]
MSWLRGYDLGCFSDMPPRTLLDEACPPDSAPVDVDADPFFDIQTLRMGHVARQKLAPVAFTGNLRGRDIEGSVVVHLLAHQSGFVIVRAVVRSDSVRVPGGVGADVLNGFDDVFWQMDAEFTWDTPQGPIKGFVRNLMNWVFLDLFERLRRPGEGFPLDWAIEREWGCERLHAMNAAGLITFPFPVSFGTQYEIVDPLLDPLVTDRPRELAKDLAKRLLFPADPWSEVDPVDLGGGMPEAWWFLAETQMLTLATSGSVDDRLDVVDRDRTQLLEFFALRRAALTCVQRATQKVLTQRLRVTRDQIERWQHIVASTTDDYIVHGRIGRLLAPVHKHNAADPRIRDLAGLEAQVRENLAWFQERLDTQSDWTGGLVGATVGAAALVLSLQDVVKSLLAEPGQDLDAAVIEHSGLFALIMMSLTVSSFTLALQAIRLVTRRLRPFTFHSLRVRRR